MSATPIRLLLVDDHPLVLQGIGAQLEQADGFEIAAWAGTAAAALAAIKAEPVDVSVVDLSLPDMPGLELIGHLRAARPGIGIVVLTMHDEEDYVLRAVSQGARGYVLKEQSSADLGAAVRAVHAGHSYFSPRITTYLVDRVAGQGPAPAPAALTSREIQVLGMIAAGQANRRIAERLCLSVRTVQTYRERLMKKLDLHTIADLTRYAVAQGLVDIPASTRE